MSRSKNKKEEEHSDQGARLLFPETEVRAGDAMHVLVCGIDPALIWIAGLSSVLRGRVHWCTDAGKSRNRLTLSHFVSREKRLPSRQTRSASRSFVMISNPDPAFSASQKGSWGACLGKCPDNRFPCSLSPKVLHVRTTNPLRKTDSPGHAGAAGNSDHCLRESWEKYCRSRNMRQTLLLRLSMALESVQYPTTLPHS